MMEQPLRRYSVVGVAPFPLKESNHRMDMNQLLHDHQFAKLLAQHAPLPATRGDNRVLASQMAARITAWRRDKGLSALGWPRDDRACLAAV